MPRNLSVDEGRPTGRVLVAVVYLTVLVVLALTFWGGVAWLVESLVRLLSR